MTTCRLCSRTFIFSTHFFIASVIAFVFFIIALSATAVVWAQTIQKETSATYDNQAFTFAKQFRIEDWSEARGVLQTKDGGYVFTGKTLFDKQGMLGDENAFITKVDAQGIHQWTKLFQTFHSVRIDHGNAGIAKKGEETGQDIVELNDGSFLVAIQGTGFVTSDYLKRKEKWGDIFLAKFDRQGKHVWTKMVGDYATDRVTKIFATKDNGFLFSGSFMQTGFGEKTAPSYFVLAKFDRNGKNEWSRKVGMNNVDIEPLTDGGFIALGDVKTAGRESGPAEKFANTTMPVVVKFNSNFGTEWTRSIEIVPFEESVYKTDESGHTGMSHGTKREAAGTFIAVRSMSDGYVVLGYLSPTLTGGSTWSTPAGTYALAAVKLDFAGTLQWAKSIKVGMKLDDVIRDTKIIKSTDKGFIVKMHYLPPPRSDQENKAEVVDEKLQQLNDLCERKNRVQDCEDGRITNDQEILSAWEAYVKTVRSFENNLNNGLVLLKTDANFNPLWSKTIHLEDYLYGYGLAPTADGGGIVAGSYVTSRLNYSTSMGQGYFQDAVLMKFDLNGAVAQDQENMVADVIDLASKDVGPYLVTKNFSPVVGTFSLKIDKRVQPKTPTNKTVVTDLCRATVSLATLVTSPFPTLVPPQIPPVTKTWATISFDTAESTEEIKPIFKTASEVHQELLPILSELFVGEVKLKKDVFGGLEYIVGRLVNESDKLGVKQYLEGRGYKTYTNDTDQLVMMKIGRTLTISFSMKNKTKGTIFVTY